ncbi:BMP/retinoic acid-inducible neural-specific protein 3-like isoform X3 [Channa argus]|uniref:BMP/retinoic acid-inducible neural-specific protein 3-like isoform X3 n=1 Tax=Channa argus TaxID=215402 RepID=UPI00352252D1
MSCQRISHKRLSLLWEGAALSLWLCCCWTSRAATSASAAGAAAAAGQGDGAPGSLGWLLSDKGPFHQSLEFTEAAERYQQGFNTRYKIYREFGRWKVNSLAVEKRDKFGGSGGLALPLDPDFMQTIRQLGRRPTLQTITESVIKKYGTHVLLSATLGGLQVILPGYLQSRFIQAALNYIGCKSEGQFICQNSDCWCECSTDYPQCNCPHSDLDTLENNLLHIKDGWRLINQEFEESEEFQSFVGKLPTHYAVNTSVVEQLWRTDASLLQRYRQLETSSNQLLTKARRTANKLFILSKRCTKQPKIVLQRPRPLHFWLSYALSILYCSENNQVGVYSDDSRSCSCPYKHPPCQALIPCSVGDGPRCASCSTENRTRCSSCNPSFALTQGACRPAVPDPTDPYLGLESDRDLQDLELRYLLQRRDPRISLHAVFVSNDVRVNTWFDPSWRKRMLLTLKSNRVKSNRVHMLLGLALQFCLTRNSTLEPALSLFVNPFGGSHSESWTMPIGQHGYPDWERTKLDIPLDCYNWTLILGNRWKSFFETVHFYLRSRIRDSLVGAGGNKNATMYYEPLEETEPSNNIGYMKVNSMQLFGYSVHFDPEAIQDLILQIDYPYTQGSQDSALLQLVELRYRVNRLSPPGAPHVDLFACLLRHRLKLSSTDVTRILTALQAFSARQPNYVDYEANKLCS